jgi:hypothetical protein
MQRRMNILANAESSAITTLFMGYSLVFNWIVFQLLSLVPAAWHAAPHLPPGCAVGFHCYLFHIVPAVFPFVLPVDSSD